MIYGILANTAKTETSDVLEKLVQALRSQHAEFYVHDEVGHQVGTSRGEKRLEGSLLPLEEILSRAGMIVALGGDGTMLSAARSVGPRELPILGINLGKLGFLAEISVSDLERCFHDIEDGRYLVEDRIVLEATVGEENEKMTALNEIVIDRGGSARVIEFETWVDGDYLVTYAADGMIITTPTGSTGYSLATGGPIVTPQCDVVTIIAISPHTLTARPVILPSGRVVRVSVGAGPTAVHVIADGQVENSYATPVECVVRRATFKAKLVRWRKGSYFDLLRMKLMWGKDLRTGQETER